MAWYSQQLLAPYVAQIAALSEKVGRLEAELEQARAAARQTPNAPQAVWPEGRPWWQRLLWG